MLMNTHENVWVLWLQYNKLHLYIQNLAYIYVQYYKYIDSYKDLHHIVLHKTTNLIPGFEGKKKQNKQARPPRIL